MELVLVNMLSLIISPGRYTEYIHTYIYIYIFYRSGTAVAKSDTHFAILTKDDFKQIMESKEIERLKQTTDFFMNLPYFNDRSRRQMDRMHFIFTKKEYNRNQIVFDFEDEPTQLYIVESGEYDVSICKK